MDSRIDRLIEKFSSHKNRDFAQACKALVGGAGGTTITTTGDIIAIYGKERGTVLKQAMMDNREEFLSECHNLDLNADSFFSTLQS